MTDRVEAMDRASGLRADITRASSALTTVVAAYLGAASPLGAIDPAAVRDTRLQLVGLGSSRFAALDAAVAMRGAGLFATAALPSECVEPPTTGLTVVAISASGRTAEVVETARRHRGTSRVIAVTNRPDSPLADASDVVLPLLAGEEASGISTLTSRATVAVLGWLADHLEGQPVDRAGISDAIARLEPIGRGDEQPGIRSAADLLDGAASIDVLASGPRIGAASQAALMLREAPRLPAHPYETADWLHTGVYLAVPGHRVVLLTGSPSDAEIVEVIRRRGGEVIAVGGPVPGAAVRIPGSTSTRYRDLVESALVDLLAAELWDRATASG